MRILAYTHTYASTTVTFITNELKVVDKEHELLFVYSERINESRYQLKNMHCIPYKFNRIINKLRWWLEQSEIYYSLYHRKFRKRINDLINDFNPNIIHCHFGTDFLKIYANLNKQNRSIPILISFYGFDVTERIKNRAVLKRYHKLLSSKNVHSVAVSKSLVDNINNYIEPANAAVVLSSGIDVDFFKRKFYEIDDKEFIFLQVSSFYEKKGHKYTLEAFKKFIDQNKERRYKFIIAGFGPLEKEIKLQIESLGLEDNVQLRGPVSPTEMVELSSKVNCFVQMSVTAKNGDQEGLPNVLLEAMSLELPVLSTLHAGIPDIIENGVNGILCKERDIEAYVDGFNQITKWRILPQNRQKIIERFSLKSHIKELNNVYNSIRQ